MTHVNRLMFFMKTALFIHINGNNLNSGSLCNSFITTQMQNCTAVAKSGSTTISQINDINKHSLHTLNQQKCYSYISPTTAYR